MQQKVGHHETRENEKVFSENRLEPFELILAAQAGKQGSGTQVRPSHLLQHTWGFLYKFSEFSRGREGGGSQGESIFLPRPVHMQSVSDTLIKPGFH